MARPIKPTPILFGDDAREFNWRATHLPPLEERIAEGNRVKEGAARFMSMVNINCDF